MYTKPKGLLPNITALVGFLIPGSAIVMYLPVSAKIFGLDGGSFLDKTGGLIFTMIILFFPFFFGVLLSSMFPEIKIEKQGIAYRYWQFLGGMIKWEEIDSVIVEKGFSIIVISRPGIPLFNGLYFNKLHGRIFKVNFPVLLASIGITAQDELIQTIDKNSSCMIRKRNL